MGTRGCFHATLGDVGVSLALHSTQNDWCHRIVWTVTTFSLSTFHFILRFVWFLIKASTACMPYMLSTAVHILSPWIMWQYKSISNSNYLCQYIFHLSIKIFVLFREKSMVFARKVKSYSNREKCLSPCFGIIAYIEWIYLFLERSNRNRWHSNAGRNSICFQWN